jgi:glutaredoxin 2
MHFVSSQSEAEQITDIVSFFTEHIEDSIQAPQTSPAFADFQSKINKLNGAKDYKGMLNYLLSIKNELLSLPTSHKNQ